MLTNILKKRVLVLTLLGAVLLTQGACRTTQEDRVQIGTISGAAIGAGIGSLSGGAGALPGAVAGAAVGAIAGYVTD